MSDRPCGTSEVTQQMVAPPSLRISAGPAPPDLGLGPVTEAGAEWTDIEGRVAVRGTAYAFGAAAELVGVAWYALADGSDTAVAWPTAGRTEADVIEGFDRTVLPLLLTHRGAQYVHASAVASPQGVVALCGTSGTGKSTLAAGLTRVGTALWADDAVVFKTGGGPAPVSLRLRTSLRLDDDARRLIQTVPAASSPSEPPEPGAVRPLRAVIVLERGNGPVRIEHLRGADAVTALLRHALCLTMSSPATRRRLAADYLSLVGCIEVRRFVFAPGRAAFPDVVQRLAEEVRVLAG